MEKNYIIVKTVVALNQHPNLPMGPGVKEGKIICRGENKTKGEVTTKCSDLARELYEELTNEVDEYELDWEVNKETGAAFLVDYGDETMTIFQAIEEANNTPTF